MIYFLKISFLKKKKKKKKKKIYICILVYVYWYIYILLSLGVVGCLRATALILHFFQKISLL